MDPLDHDGLSKEERKRLKKEKKEKKKLKKELKRQEKERKRSSSPTFGFESKMGDMDLPAINSFEPTKPMNAIPPPLTSPTVTSGPRSTTVAPMPNQQAQPRQFENVPPSQSNKLTRRDKKILCCRFLIGILLMLIAFVFFSIIVRTSNPIKVNENGELLGLEDPFGLNPGSSEPLRVGVSERHGGSLLDLADVNLEDASQIKSLRFVVKNGDDYQVMSEVVSSISRSSAGTVTTVLFNSGNKLIIDTASAVPLQVRYFETTQDVYLQVEVDEYFDGSVQGASGCGTCGTNMHLDDKMNCVCDDGFLMEEEKFGCYNMNATFEEDGEIISQPKLTENSSLPTVYYHTADVPSDHGSCIGQVVYPNQRLDTKATRRADAVFYGPSNPWGSALDPVTHNQTSKTHGTKFPLCNMGNWTFRNALGDNVTYHQTGCASLGDVQPVLSKDLIADFDRFRNLRYDRHILWCIRSDLDEYVLDSTDANPSDANLLWGVCIPCHHTPAPVPSPTSAPVVPTAAPTRAPIGTGETASPTMSPTESDLLGEGNSNSTLAPTGSDFFNETNITITDGPTTSPTMSPTPIPGDCLTSTCQSSNLTFAAAKDFCTSTLDMRLCTKNDMLRYYEELDRLYRSDILSRADALATVFECPVADPSKVNVWVVDELCPSSQGNFDLASGHHTCVPAVTNTSTIVLTGMVKCCDHFATGAEQEFRKESAKKQISSSISISLGGSGDTMLDEHKSSNKRLRFEGH